MASKGRSTSFNFNTDIISSGELGVESHRDTVALTPAHTYTQDAHKSVFGQFNRQFSWSPVNVQSVLAT